MMHGLINQEVVVHVAYAVGVLVGALSLLSLVGWAIRRYQFRQARRRAAGPLQVVVPRSAEHNRDLLGAEFMVIVDDLIG